MKFVIIMFFYNVEKRLVLFIDSIIKQFYSFLKYVEVLFINDGSMDGSGVIVNCYVIKYFNNICVLIVLNGGLVKVCNIGIYNVSEDIDFVGFLDVDDIMLENMLVSIVIFLNEFNVFMFVLVFYYLDDFGSKKKILLYKLNYCFVNGN